MASVASVAGKQIVAVTLDLPVSPDHSVVIFFENLFLQWLLIFWFVQLFLVAGMRVLSSLNARAEMRVIVIIFENITTYLHTSER